MTTKPFEPSREDPGLRPDTEPDETPVVVPGLDPEEPTPGGDPSEPTPPEPQPGPAQRTDS